MDETVDNFINWNKSNPERKILHVLSHMCTLNYMHMISYEKYRKDYLRKQASRSREGGKC